MKTPLFDMHKRLKQKYPDHLLLFELNDFFESFEDDAVNTSKVLGIVLAKRLGVPMTRFPKDQLEINLIKLVKAGYKVEVVNNL